MFMSVARSCFRARPAETTCYRTGTPTFRILKIPLAQHPPDQLLAHADGGIRARFQALPRQHPGMAIRPIFRAKQSKTLCRNPRLDVLRARGLLPQEILQLGNRIHAWARSPARHRGCCSRSSASRRRSPIARASCPPPSPWARASPCSRCSACGRAATLRRTATSWTCFRSPHPSSRSVSARRVRYGCVPSPGSNRMASPSHRSR